MDASMSRIGCYVEWQKVTNRYRALEARIQRG